MKINYLIIIFSALILACSVPQDKTQYETKLLIKAATTDVTGTIINFPDSNAAITSAIRVLKAGESTGIHRHEGIPVVYMIEGEITITSETGEIQKVVKKGEAFIGSTKDWHETTNTGNVDAVAQVVFIGATNLQNTINQD